MSFRRLALSTLLAAFEGPVAPDWVHDLTASGIGGFVLFASNVVDADQLAALSASIHSVRPDALIAIDEEGGDVTRLGHRDGSPYPGNGALGSIDDPDLTRTIYGSIGDELARAGIDLNLAPTVDVNTSSTNPVIGTRSFGADPLLVARHSTAAVIGLQSAGVAACAKHFPGHGATTADSHLEMPIVDATHGVLTERDLPPFQAAAMAGSQAIMTAHIRIPALTGDAPATFSPAAIALLRDQIGYTGVVVTDALEMQGAARYAGGSAAGAVLALVAGADLLCIGSKVTAEMVDEVVEAIIDAVNDRRLPLARLEEAAARVADLAAWVAANRPTPPPLPTARVGQASDHVGLAAARRAVIVDGMVPDLSRALVVQLEATTTIAQGRVPWGVLRHLPPGTATTSLRVAASEATPAQLTALAAGHPIVVTGRNLHRLTGATALIESLTSTNEVVVVEMGWPSGWRPKNASAFITTYGASQANSLAAAEALHLRSCDDNAVIRPF